MNNNDYNNRNKSIYNDGNPYGYRYNVNHPKINELYRRYKKWKGIPSNFPMSNEQRLEFECYIDGLIANQT